MLVSKGANKEDCVEVSVVIDVGVGGWGVGGVHGILLYKLVYIIV